MSQVLSLVKDVTPEVFNASFGTEVHQSNGCLHASLAVLPIIPVDVNSAPTDRGTTSEKLLSEAVQHLKQTSGCTCPNGATSEKLLKLADTIIIVFSGENLIEFKDMSGYPHTGFTDHRKERVGRSISNSLTITLEGQKFQLTAMSISLKHPRGYHAVVFTGPHGNFSPRDNIACYSVDGNVIGKISETIVAGVPADLLVYERVGESSGVFKAIEDTETKATILECEKRRLRYA